MGCKITILRPTTQKANIAARARPGTCARRAVRDNCTRAPPRGRASAVAPDPPPPRLTRPRRDGHVVRPARPRAPTTRHRIAGPLCYEAWGPESMRVLKVCCTKAICQACDVQMELRGHDNCPFCRCEPLSAADELAKLEHWAAKDSAAAVCQLGSCYRRGDLGLEIDSPRAVALYERAVELGDAKAVVHLGLMLADGDGCTTLCIYQN